MIKNLGLAEVKIFDGFEMREEEMMEMLDWADVIVQQSAMGVQTVANTAKFKQSGKTVVGDYDDLTFSLSPFNPAYKTLGLNEVRVNYRGKDEMLWVDGRDGFSIKENYFRYKSLQDLLKLFDLTTTASSVIKDRYSKFSDNIKILPNSIDFNIFKPLPKKDTGKIRIGWTASDSHYAEIWMVKRIMRKVVDKYGDKVQFVLLGNIQELYSTFKPHELERHDFIGLDVYPLKFASLGLDIGLCPLDDIEFNRAKSQLKWSEYSALKIPTVCSNLDPYYCVEDGKTGLLANTEEDFFNRICELVDNAELREKISFYAYDKNYEDYNLEKNAILWVEAYEQAREICELKLLDAEALVRDIPKTSLVSDTK
jgi:glycosyltransferase involved in cell wall biosynthesis